VLLHEFMLKAARDTPDRPAVVESGPEGLAATSYRQLETRVRHHAASLRELGIGVGDRVVLESDTSASAIAVFLACSTVGAAFVPVSPDTPDERLGTIVHIAQPALHLRAGERARDLPAAVGTARFDRDQLTVDRLPATRRPHRRTVTGTDTAYIIFTSGTTGRPKGVVMSHRGVVSFYQGMMAERIVGPDDRVASTSPLQFDFSLLDIGLALGSGATLVPVPRSVLVFPRMFLQLLIDARVTHVDGVPSIWRPVLRHEPDGLAALPELRSILFCGEPFPLAELRQIQRSLPGRRIVNCYGATESMAASFRDVPDPLPEHVENLSIGTGHAGAEMLLFDAEGRLVDEPGVPGEIHLYSPALFTGYWNDPETTRRTLVPDPLAPASGRVVLRTGDLAHRDENGELYFRGRVDSQVQIRGNRVELAEVERRIQEYRGVLAAAALALPEPDGELALHAFVVTAPGEPPLDEAALAAFCKQTLNSYMVPSQLHAVDRLPVTAHGKTDRKALAARYAATPA
jgi:amino acid adenylation domain-containing protein